jgi:hypothetical protein
MMRTRSFAGRSARIFAVPVLLAGAAAGMTSVTPAAAAAAGTQAPRASVPFSGQLNGAAVAPGGTAWAVGYTSGEALPEHWNGKNWTFEQDLNAAPSGDFYSVAATSAGNAWTVGETQDTTGIHTLILHWNGKTWSQVPSPGGAGFSLHAVTATSSSNAWAVGTTGDQSASLGFILHWNGTAWTRAPSPNPGHSDELYGVAATGTGNAWAVGTEYISPGIGPLSPETLILHWNGAAWARVASPNPFCSSCDSLDGVAAASARSAWAVGTLNLGGEVVILHWNGTSWANSTSANLLNYP